MGHARRHRWRDIVQALLPLGTPEKDKRVLAQLKPDDRQQRDAYQTFGYEETWAFRDKPEQW